jgi:hypothetical protein
MSDKNRSSNRPQGKTRGADAASRHNQRGTADAVRQTAEAAQQGGRAAVETSRRIGAEAAQRSADTVQGAGSATNDTLDQSTRAVAEGQRLLTQEAAQCFEGESRKMSQAIQGTTETTRTFMTLPSTAGERLNDLQRSMTGLVQGVVATNFRLTHELFRLSDPSALIKLQQRFMCVYLSMLMESSATLVRAARKPPSSLYGR